MEPNVRELLTELYGKIAGQAAMTRLQAMLDRYRADLAVHTGQRGALSQRDAMLITYGDQVREPNVPPLQALAGFCEQHLIGAVSSIHILPFYPYSSDDGFSVIDYKQVDPALGDWEDVTRIGQTFRLMFDGVINHISAESEWFKAFLRDDRKYREYFIAVEDDPDLSQVVRPRALPLLTEVSTPAGKKKVWTTFSTDQIDLNYRNPAVLLDIIDTLLFYVTQSAEFLRLDAIAYLWKEIGTPCIHLPQAHRVIQLIRAVLDEVAPHVTLITETNVPHEDNVSYFGNGYNEAQLVYNFALPPLTLHTLHTGNARALTMWAASLSLPSGDVTFFNFLASHDGIGLNPARGILSDSEIEALVDRTVAHGGLVSHKQNPDGSHSPYELNINYFDALSNPSGGEPIGLQLDRFVAAHAIMLSIGGVPGIYFHSLFGSRGWPEGVQLTSRNRTINRQKIDRATLERELNDPTSLRHQVFSRLKHLLRVRSTSAAFRPSSPQRVLQFGEAIFAVLRDDRVLCLHNVSAQPQTIRLDRDWQTAIDLIAARKTACDADGAVMLAPYQILWLTGNDHDR